MLDQGIRVLRRTASEALQIPQYYFAYLFRNGRAFPPVRVDFELTYRCNLRCQFCPQELFKSRNKDADYDKKAEKKELKTDEIKGVIDDLKAGGVPLVTLTGGEPFVRRDIMDIITHIKSAGLSLSILSNGALMNREIAEEVVRLGVDAITFSLDGPEKLHDEVRGVPNTYNRMIQSIGYLADAREKHNVERPHINLNCTISALNQQVFSQLVDVGAELGVDSINFGFLFFTNEEAVEKTSSIVDIKQAKPEDQILPDHIREVDIELLKKEIHACYDRAQKNGLCISFNPPLHGDRLKEYFYNYEYSYANKCFFPWKVSRVNPQGDVYPCSIDKNMGNLRDRNFFQIWNGKDYIDFRLKLKKNKLFSKCHKCCELQTKIWSLLP